jgi:hypothetical protein
MSETVLDQETILRVVRTWPQAEQLALAQEIERQAIEPPATPVSAGNTAYASFEDALGLLATPGKPAPTDEEIDQLRMEKYDN